MRLHRRMFMALALPLLTCAPAFAQGYPSQPITLIVPFPPGGGTDIVARELAATISAQTGWKFIVENKPGAGGNLGVASAVRAAPDGYTIVLGQTSNLAINPTLYPKLPYAPLKDLEPISLVARAPLVLVTSSSSKYASFDALLSAARQHPGKINFAYPGNGTVSHLTGQQIEDLAGVRFQPVPYKGTARAAVDLMAGSVDLYIASVPSAMPFVAQGKMRPLAVTSATPSPDLPRVPTVAQLGFRGFDAANWWGLAAPAGTPADIVSKLGAAVNRALADPGLRERFTREGADPVGSTPGQFKALIASEIVRWGKLVKASGVQVD